MREESLFEAALALPAQARGAFLDDACGGDVGLRERVERLLAADNLGRGILDDDPAKTLSPYCPRGPALAVDDLFAGRFRLVRQLGEGGMGEVWVADQTAPVHRIVALKVVRPGLGDIDQFDRFEQERQALALMDHPNIAKVLDAGVADGRPFFAMEFIEGVPITKYCDARDLTAHDRLRLFVPVCQAVQHAHQKGIIHRDLKPDNVLVAEYDGKPVPKVIDFGVAKAAGVKLTEDTVRTGLGAIVGTLEYMAPEQAAFDARDIDTRADVYALGVLLYELLTGGPPIRRADFPPDKVLDVLQAIRETDPPRPSQRLTRAPAKAAAVRGDLDWIAMKCLAKDRAERYETVNGLARDVQRFLADEPVEARPPSAGYRLRKFVHRHTVGLTAAAAIAIALLAGGVVSVWQAVRALDAERQARASESQAILDRDAKEAARQAEFAQRLQALAEQERATEEAAIAQAVQGFLEDDLLGQADIANQPGGERDRGITVRAVLDRAADRVGDRFRGQERTEAAIRLTLGRAYRAVGEYPKAQTHLERSLALRQAKQGRAHRDTLESIRHLAFLHEDRHDYDKAEGLFREVLEARRAVLGADDPETLRAQNDLGLLYLERGNYDQADPLLRGTFDARRSKFGGDHPDTLESLNNLARLHRDRGQFHLAEPLFKQARDGRRARLGADHPLTLDTMHGLAGLYIEWGRYGEAEPLYDQLVALQRAKLGADHHATLVTLGDLALVYQMQRRFDKAEALYEQVLAGFRAKLEADHPDLLRGIQNLAMCYGMSGKPDKAEPLYREALTGQRIKPGAGHPDTIVTMANLAVLYRDTGEYDKALPLFREALAAVRKAHGLGHPDAQTIVSHLTVLHRKQGRPDLAEPILQELVAALRGDPGPESYLLANALGHLAANLLEQKRYAAAEAVGRECLAIRGKYRPDAWTTFHTKSLVGGALLGQKKYPEAEPLLRQGYQGMKDREGKIPPDSKFALTEGLDRLIALYETWKPSEVPTWRAERDARQAKKTRD